MSKPLPGDLEPRGIRVIFVMMSQTAKSKQNLLAVFIVLLAFAFRIVNIDRIPAGLSHDEAYNGVTAIQVLNGQRLIFFEINKGIEPLIIYLEALAFYAFGVGPIQLRLVNILCGLLTVALVYPLTGRLFNRRVALLAMAMMAVSFWPIFVSRLTLRAVTLPPLLILTLYFLWRGHEAVAKDQLSILQSPLLFFSLSGLAAGASMYTYLSSRFVPLLVLSIFGYWLVRGQMKRQHWPGLLLHFVLWAVIFVPLANYYWQNSSSFTERADQVTTIPYLLNGEFEPMLRNGGLTLGMFTFRGDETDRYNLDGRPVFDWVNGLLFYGGVGIALLRLRNRPKVAGPAALLLLWLLWMLVPDLITDDSPHFLRTIGAMPAVYIFWAVGAEGSIGQIGRRYLKKPLSRLFSASRPTSPLSRLFASLLILALLIFAAGHTAYDYFGRWASSAGARTIYGADIAEIAAYMQGSGEESLVAISSDYYRDLDPFRLALHFRGEPPFVIWFDGRQSLAFPPPESGLSPRYLFSTSAPPADLWSPLLVPSPEDSGQEYALYRLPSAPELERSWNGLFPTPADGFTPVNVNNDLLLLNYQVLGSVVSGGKFQVLLGWQALRSLPPGTDYTFLVRMVDSQDHTWVWADGNGYPPVNWQPGVRALQLLTLRLPGDLPPRTYRLLVEVLDRQTGLPLPTGLDRNAIPLAILSGQLADSPQVIDPDRVPNPVGGATVNAAPAEESGLVLRGYQLGRSTVGPEERLLVTLYWQVREQPRHSYHWQFFLVQEDGSSFPPVHRWPPIEPIGGEWPTSRWPAGYWVQDKIDLPLESNIPAGQYKLRGILVSPETEEIALPSLDRAGFELGSVTIGTVP